MSESTYSQRYNASSDTSTAGSFAFDTIGGKDYAESKIGFGAVGSITFVDASNPFPVTLGTATVTVTGSGGTFPVTDSGGSLTVDNAGTFAVQAAQSGTWNIATLTGITNVVHVDDNSGSLTVDGTVGISGTVTVDSELTTADLDTGAGTDTRAVVGLVLAASGGGLLVGSANPMPISDNSGSITVDNGGTFAVQAAQSGTWNIGTVTTITNVVHVDDNSSSLTVDNGGTFASQDSQVVADNAGFTDGTTKVFMSGYVYDEVAGTALTENDAAAARINANRAVVGIIEDGSTRGRYATVTASNALKVDASGVAVPVTDNSGSLTVDNSGTFAVQAAQSGTWNVTNVSGTVSLPTGASTLSEQQTQTTSLQLIDDIVYTDDTSTHSTGSSKGALIMAAATPTDTSVNANDIGAVAMTTDRKLHVSVQDSLPAGTNGIGKLTSNSGVTIGAVEIAAAQTLATVSTLSGGPVAHDGSDTGNPHKVGARAALTLSDDTMVSNGDRTDAVSDGDGAIIIRPQFPLADLISERITDTGGSSTAFSNFGATANTRSYITAISAYNSSATAGYIDFRDGTGGSVLWTVPIPAGGGVAIASEIPFFKTTANTALAYDVSAALSTVYLSVSGFKSKVV